MGEIFKVGLSWGKCQMYDQSYGQYPYSFVMIFQLLASIMVCFAENADVQKTFYCSAG